MEDMQELKQDVKEIKAKVGEIAISTAVNTASLKEHMSRTALSERRIQTLEYWLLGILGSGLLGLIISLLLKH